MKAAGRNAGGFFVSVRISGGIPGSSRRSSRWEPASASPFLLLHCDIQRQDLVSVDVDRYLAPLSNEELIQNRSGVSVGAGRDRIRRSFDRRPSHSSRTSSSVRHQLRKSQISMYAWSILSSILSFGIRAVRTLIISVAMSSLFAW